ncbi:hypothetical protein Tco_0150917 [Tanacetum coccineum]
MLLEISQELYVSMNTRKKLIYEFKEKVGSMVDMSSICFLDRLQYREMNMRVVTLKHVNEMSHELYISMNTRKKLIDEFKEKVGSMVDMSSIRFLDRLQYREMNMRVDTLNHVNEVHARLLERSNFMLVIRLIN